jgi:hypothetical protein
MNKQEEPIVVTKKQLVEMVNERAENEKINEVIIPNEEASMIIKKRDVDDYINFKKANIDIVPVNKNNNKTYRMTSNQFGQLIQTVDDDQVLKASELDI